VSDGCFRFLGTRARDKALVFESSDGIYALAPGEAGYLSVDGRDLDLDHFPEEVPLDVYRQLRVLVCSDSAEFVTDELPRHPGGSRYRCPKIVKQTAERGYHWLVSSGSDGSSVPGALDVCSALTSDSALDGDVISHMRTFFESRAGKSTVRGSAVPHTDGVSEHVLWEMFGGDEGAEWVGRLPNPHAITAASSSSAPQQTDSDSSPDLNNAVVAPQRIETVFESFVSLDEQFPQLHDFRPGQYGMCEVCGTPKNTLLHDMLALNATAQSIDAAHRNPIINDEDEAMTASATPGETALFYFIPRPDSDSIDNVYVSDEALGWALWDAASGGWQQCEEPSGHLPIDRESAEIVARKLQPGHAVHPREINEAEWALFDEEAVEAFEEAMGADEMRKPGRVQFFVSNNNGILAHSVTTGSWWQLFGSSTWASYTPAADTDAESISAESADSVCASLGGSLSHLYADVYLDVLANAQSIMYTEEERRANAAKQIRDKNGRFARIDARVSVNGRHGTIVSTDPSSQAATVRFDDAADFETVPAKSLETIKAVDPSSVYGKASIAPGYRREVKSTLPRLLEPMSPSSITAAISDYIGAIRDSRSDPTTLAAPTPDHTDVKPLRLAIVDPIDPQSVLDLVALVPSGMTGGAVTAYTRDVNNSWKPSPQIIQQLKSTNPPRVVMLSDDDYPSVLAQVDDYYARKTVAEQRAEQKSTVTPVAAAGALWDEYGVLLPLIGGGGLDRNRGNAERLRHYWTRGPGALKIRWGMPGDWSRCFRHLSKHLGPRAAGYCNLRHKEVLGFYPATHAKILRGSAAEAVEIPSDVMFLTAPGRVFRRADTALADIADPVLIAMYTPTIEQRKMLDYPVLGTKLKHGDTFLVDTNQGTMAATAYDPDEVLGWTGPQGRILRASDSRKARATFADGSDL
jgi:hypothetical protein